MVDERRRAVSRRRVRPGSGREVVGGQFHCGGGGNLVRSSRARTRVHVE